MDLAFHISCDSVASDGWPVFEAYLPHRFAAEIIPPPFLCVRVRPTLAERVPYKCYEQIPPHYTRSYATC